MGLAEALTVLQTYKMTVVVTQVDAVPSDLEIVMGMEPASW